MILADTFIKPESEENPKMLEVRLNNLYQDVFCYGLAVEENEQSRHTLKMAIIAGNDSSLQAIKASMDIGTNGINFGYGYKMNNSWQFQPEIRSLYAEKGKYSRFPLPIEGESNFKAMIIVHDDVLSNAGDYIISFNKNPAQDIRRHFGGSKYGLHLLPEWEQPLYEELQYQDHLVEVPIYLAEGFDISILKLTLSEEEADNLISSLIRNGRLRFKDGIDSSYGQSIKKLDSLEEYLTENVDPMMEKVNEQVTPIHDPLYDKEYPYFDDYDRPLFPVQAHVATALVKKLNIQKNILLEGEMSTGKTTMMTAIADAYAKQKGKKGFFSCVMVPPNLTKKWPKEIKEILKDAEVHVIEQSSQLIEYHSAWTRKGRPKPTKPTFFVISYNTMRDGSAIRPAVEFKYKKTDKQRLDGDPYRFGWYCPSCGKPHQQVIDSQTTLDEEGNEVVEEEKAVLTESQFGTTRRVHKSKLPANAFCSECGESLWTRKVVNRYSSFKEWKKHEKKLHHAIEQDSPTLVSHIQKTQEPIPKKRGYPRRVAAVDYIRRKMKNFFDLTIVDEIHLTKSGNTAQGNALGALAGASKHLIGGTGTLFGGKAEDVFYILYRLFPSLMKKNGFEYNEVMKWNHEFGNVERKTVTYGSNSGPEYSNKNSHGGHQTRTTEKVLPGISPFVYGKFLVQNSCLVRLVDVWPDPVDLVDVPTIFVPMDKELNAAYEDMVSTFESEIDSRDDGKKLYLPLTQNGVAYPDNPFTYPDVHYKMLDNESGTVTKQHIWSPKHLDEDIILNKERKLQEIIQDEMNEGRKSIVYVRDTGSSSEGRDVRPRLKKVLEAVGAKVCILSTTTTKTNNRSEWLEKKIEDEGYDVCIVSQELVKVGLDLICTPTLIFYQFSWSLFTINQAARRAWRIGQTEECRIFYLAYANSYQEQMAHLIAKKKKAAAAISGDVSSDGLSAMLGDEGDLQAMLVNSIKKGEVVKGSAEEWVSQTSDRAREILSGIGKEKDSTPKVQFRNWVKTTIQNVSTQNVLIKQADTIVSGIKQDKYKGFKIKENVLEVDLVEAFGLDLVDDKVILSYLISVDKKTQTTKPTNNEDVQLSLFTVGEEKKKKAKRKTKSTPVEGQLGFDLFAM